MLSIRAKSLVGLAVIGIIDVLIPLPILGGLLVYVVLERPSWFAEWVERVYLESS